MAEARVAVLRAGQWLAYAALRLGAGAVRLLPLRLAFELGGLLGLAAPLLLPKYRRLVRRNLEIAFGGEREAAALDRLARRVFPRLGANLLAGVKLGGMAPEFVLGRLEIDGRARLEAAAAAGRGMVVAVSHMGCWEVLALVGKLGWAGTMARPASLYQPMGNPFVDASVKRMRERSGVELIDRRGGFARPASVLAAGGTLGVLVDQHAGDKGVWCPFFGRLASTSNLAALLSLRTGAPVVPVALVTAGAARWRLEVGEPLMPDLAAGAGVGQLTAELNLRVEQAVRRSPEDWFWVHRRWKTPRPNFLLRHYKRGIRTAPPLSESSLKPFRTLVRSPNWLGDACMAVPAVRAVKRGRPDCHLTVLAPARLADLWRAVAEVDEVLEIPAGAGVWGAARAVRRAGHQFDAGVLLPNSPRAALEMWLGGVPERFGVAGKWRRRLLTKVVKEREAPGRVEHHARHFLRIAHELGAETGEPVLFAPLPVGVAGAPDGSGALRLGLCPGAEYGPAKRWPAARFAEVAAAVCQARADADWVLFGVAADAGPAAEVEAAIPAGRCENLVGQTTLAGLIDELRRCRLVLANDTGTMHLAALLGVPVVAVFGSTDPDWTGPVGEGHAVVRRHVECSPCFLRECPLDLRCLLEVEPSRVQEAVLARLPPPSSGRGV